MKSAMEIKCDQVDVCLILYNESCTIEKSLVSLKKAGFDSFLALDMESTDDTLAKIRLLLGDLCKIIEYPRSSLFRYGFAEARNVCASFSTRRWVLFVDADEVLTSGVAEGSFLISRTSFETSVGFIERKNLVANFPGNDDLYRIQSVEKHDRLYVPHACRRWRGYIHEQIFCEQTTGYEEDKGSSLVFDHFSFLKPLSENRTGLYSFMLIRSFWYPELRDGTNGWWYDHYVQMNQSNLTAQAESFSKTQALDMTYYDPSAKMSAAPIFRDVGVPPSSPFDMGVLRRLHAVASSRWTASPGLALWGEWNHPGEGSRSLLSIIENAVANNWQRFISPGGICIDIGAHSGDTAIPMALFAFSKETSERGIIVAVEPNPDVRPILDFNLAANSWIADFKIVDAAITKTDVIEIELSDHGNANCNGGVLDGGLSMAVSERLRQVSGVKYKARGISLNAIFKELKGVLPNRPVEFIKIDCEGYDKEIIRPCRELFSEAKPTLFIEWFNWFEPEDDIDLFSTIEAIDYVPLNPYTLEVASTKERLGDLICVHRERLGQIKL